MIDVMVIKLDDRIRRKKLHSDLPPNAHCLLYKASIIQNLCVYNQTSRNGVATLYSRSHEYKCSKYEEIYQKKLDGTFIIRDNSFHSINDN